MNQLVSGLITGVALLKKGKFTMKFTKDSIVVKSWVGLVVKGIYNFNDVPKLFNLRTVVAQVLSEQEARIGE